MLQSMQLQKKILQNALEDGNLTKIETRKMKNRLSALESRCRQQEQLIFLTGRVDSLKAEVKNCILSLMKYEEIEISRQVHVNELLEQPVFKIPPNQEGKKRARVSRPMTIAHATTPVSRSMHNNDVGEIYTLEPAVFLVRS
jgi:hypothetical protein